MTPNDRLRQFIDQLRAGEIPNPNMVSEFVSGAEDYFDGKGSLDECLGLTTNRLKKTPAEKEEAKRVRAEERIREHAQLLFEMWELMNIFEIGISAAAEMVAVRREDFEKKTKPKAATLVEYWKRDPSDSKMAETKAVPSEKGAKPLLYQGCRDMRELAPERRPRYPDRAFYGVK
ncbi:hypothetical protein [Salinisphaera sp.]|uniref:hypothetical protein n=1 Tax=Salinisphaera sp. TaxID=1914330 RepID=UPI000C3AB5D6|nr:hypothetical protein [Salinisphaera sp.]MAS10320.1 hypothetical protein [Salinisphaera sp.]